MYIILFVISIMFSGYREDVRKIFEGKKFELVDFNHSKWGMIRSDSLIGGIADYKYVQVFDDHYVLETGFVDCRKKLTRSEFQYESWNGSSETKYDVRSGWESFVYMDLQWHFYTEVCFGERK